MSNYQVLSKILGSKYFEQLMINDKAISQTLNANDLQVNFEPNIKYFEIKKNVENVVLTTIEQLQDPISSKDYLCQISHNLFYADENQDDKIDYLYKYHFNAIYATLLKQVNLATDFIDKESEFKSAIELLEIKIKQYKCRENWLTKYLSLFEETINDEVEQRFDYNKDNKLYCVTKLKILVAEDLFIYRQKFKCKYVQLSKELSKKYRYYHIEGLKYFDDF